MEVEKIVSIRGDTIPLQVELISADVLTKGDFKSITFTARKKATKNSKVEILKTIEDVELEDNKLTLVILPEDTEELSLGTYYADIEFKLINNFTKTKRLELELVWEVTIKE